MVLMKRRVPVPVMVAFGFWVAIVLVLSILNGGNDVPYLIGIWAVIAVIGLAIYYLGSAVLHRVRR